MHAIVRGFLSSFVKFDSAVAEEMSKMKKVNDGVETMNKDERWTMLNDNSGPFSVTSSTASCSEFSESGSVNKYISGRIE